MSEENKLTRISNLPKSGDVRVEEVMFPVWEAINRHHEWPSDEFTEIYNSAYDAVYNAIKKFESQQKQKELNENP